jgi:hypothetical protein
MTTNTRDEILAIERRLWTNDAEFYAATLLPDAILAFAETGPIGRDVAVAAIEREQAEGQQWAEVEFSGVRWLTLTDEVIALTYRVVARSAHETSSNTALASSAYVKRDGAWRLAFHQQTPLASELPVRHPAGGGSVASIRAASAGALAIGAVALGATAVGALAIGRLAVGAMTLRRARVRALTVDQLTIRRLRVGELDGPDVRDAPAR